MDRRRWSEPVDERIVAEGMQLERHEMLRIAQGAQLLVAVQSGALWITEEGKPEDLFVTPGRWYRIESDALAVATALESAQVTISAPLAAPGAWQIERIGSDGAPAGRLQGRKRGSRIARALMAAWLRLYRKGARVARRAAESSRHAELVRLAAQLDRHTRKDIGLEHYGHWFPEQSMKSFH
jgi:hypothetical protein